MATETKTTALSVPAYDRVTDPLAFIKQFGNSIARSQMFGCQTVEQGEVFAMACLAKRCDPFSLVETYHVIQGRLSMRADAMLAGLVEHGGTYKLIHREPDLAAIEITTDRGTKTFLLHWDDAKKEPFIYNGKESEVIDKIEAGKFSELKMKPKYRTPRSRMQMLWARVVSDGVRTMAPQVVCGTYTPEEISDWQPSGNGNEQATQEQPPAASKSSEADVIDAEYTVADPEPAASTGQPGSQPDGMATAAQCDMITDLYVALEVPHETQQAALAKRNVTALRSLTADQATEIIAKLKATQAARASAASAATIDTSEGGPESEPAETSQSLHDPCGDVMVNQIKSALKEASQLPGNENIIARVKAKLEQHGLTKLADLSVIDARQLLAAIEQKKMEAFFAASLVSVTTDEEVPFN